MGIDLSYGADVQKIVDDTRSFTRDTIPAIEDAHNGDIMRAGGDAMRSDMQHAAKEAGVFAPHVPVEFGGAGLNMSNRAPVFEEAGYSLFGPIALNIGAPDEGNVHLLAHVANADQQEQFWRLWQRATSVAFAMTEPAPGAGSDPGGAADCRDPGGRRQENQRAQVVHYRGRWGCLLHYHGPDIGPSGRPRGSNDVSGPRGYTGHPSRPPPRHPR